jgi:sulfite reductase alpha subunit-like flavoprotein
MQNEASLLRKRLPGKKRKRGKRRKRRKRRKKKEKKEKKEKEKTAKKAKKKNEKKDTKDQKDKDESSDKNETSESEMSLSDSDISSSDGDASEDWEEGNAELLASISKKLHWERAVFSPAPDKLDHGLVDQYIVLQEKTQVQLAVVHKYFAEGESRKKYNYELRLELAEEGLPKRRKLDKKPCRDIRFELDKYDISLASVGAWAIVKEFLMY